MYFLYTLLILVFFVLCSPYFVYQAIRYRKYIGGLRQRLGYLPVSFNLDGDESIWVHAVSVGEALTASAITAALKERYPRLRLFMSTTTIAGQQVARHDVPGVDSVFYFPFDLPFIVERTLRIVRPRLLVMMETEIWPNLLHACQRAGVRTLVMNGRISARSYPRYRLIRPLFRRVLADVDRFCVQTAETARRLVDLGADAARVTVTGSLKFDSLSARTDAGHDRGRHRVLRFFRVPADRPVIIAGSTLKGEEIAVLRAFGRLRARVPGALLVVAPRHPERFGEVERLAREEGFRTVRRSELPIDDDPRADVVVLDTIGELAQLYQVATVVFVGGSLVNTGGHNILEPAAFGKPVIFGPYMQNFQEIADAFLAGGAAVRVHSESELEATLRTMLADPAFRRKVGAAARAIVEANRGAKERSLAVVADLLPPAGAGGAGVVRPFRLVH
jgi:3-deoxy-D-manno-octulosonic-acid transferase